MCVTILQHETSFLIGKYSVEFSDCVNEILLKFRQLSKNQFEACGVLVGSFDHSINRIIVKRCTEPMAMDIRKRCRFVLRDPGHQAFVDQVFKESHGQEFYLGTWHTHPELIPTPSFIDTQDWKEVTKRNRHLPLSLFIIVGSETNLIRLVINHENI